MNRWLDLLPRRTRLNVASGLAFVVFVVFLSACGHLRPNQPISTHRHRRLRWYQYEDTNDAPAHAPRIIIPPGADATTITTRDTSERLGEEEPAVPSKSDTAKPLKPEVHSLYIDSDWAQPDHDFTAESTRFLSLIQTVNPNDYCPGQMAFDQSTCCLTEELSAGVIYSFNLDQGADVAFERALMRQSDIERIYVFNPNYDPLKIKSEFVQVKSKVRRDTDTMEPEQFNTDSDELAAFSFYKVALDTQSSQNPSRRWRRKTFSQIRGEMGHEKIDLMRINMKSSEWKVLRHWLETGEMARIDQILVKVHLHWSGFGITGDDGEIVHQWYNTISSMIQSGLKLVASQPVQDGPKTFLGKSQFDTTCCYYLTFFRK